MWLKDANCFGASTWQGALDAVSGFNANPGNYNCLYYTANYNDWRLSNINEQESFFNAAEVTHAGWLLGGGYLFTKAQNYYYWSSTSKVDFSSSATWAFDMIDGEVDPGSKNFQGLYVWPVRTAPPKFVLTVTEQGTGSGTVTSVNRPGIDCGTDCTEPYEDGTGIALDATPDAGSVFAGWSGAADCSDGIVTMNAHKTCTATFNSDTHNITITKSGTGTGTVIIEGPGGPVVCGNDCTATYPAGIGISFNVLPDATSEFIGWAGDPDCADGSVVMDADKTCNAVFTRQTRTLEVFLGGSGSGRVLSDPQGIDCGADCSEDYTVNTPVTLTAVPDANSFLAGWQGDADCGDGLVTMAVDTVCVANLILRTYTLTLTKDGPGKGTVMTTEQDGIFCGPGCHSADKTYSAGTEVTLREGTAEPWLFIGWGGDPDCTDGAVTMDADKSCWARFDECSGTIRAQIAENRYDSIGEAYAAALPGTPAIIEIIAFNLLETLDLNGDKIVTLKGGHDCQFVPLAHSYTTITGSFTISRGTVTVDRIVIR
jgi:hypothetical protein